MLKKLLDAFKPKTFEGIVVNVSQIFQEGKNNLHSQLVTITVGTQIDSKGRVYPIMKTYSEGVFYVTLENPDGERKTFRTDFCYEPLIGKLMRYNLRNEVKK